MSFVRKDVFTGCRVLVSEVRGKRPINILNAVYGETSPEDCPFCPGNEHMTPQGYDGKSWSMRSFPNKYPALTETLSLAPHSADEFYGTENGAGGHEIFVDTESHCENLKDFTVTQTEGIIHGLLERYNHYAANGYKYIQIFKNQGAYAGASQSHSHWQLVAGSFVPRMQEIVSESLVKHYAETRRCLYCDVLENELTPGKRIVLDNGLFTVFAPYASRFCYETWIMPKRHVTTFAGLSEAEVAAFAEALKSVIGRLERVRRNINYNVLLMDSPDTPERQLFHWHAQILPKMGSLAGYEFSTGSYINHVTPESAAEILRSASID